MLSLQTLMGIICIKPTPLLYMHYALEPGEVTFTCFHCHFSLTGQYSRMCISTPLLRTLMLADIDNVHLFAQKFLTFASGTRQHLQWCCSANRALLMSGDVTTLPHLPLALFLHTVTLQHWCLCHPLSSSMYPSHSVKFLMTRHYPSCVLISSGASRAFAPVIHTYLFNINCMYSDM